MGNSSAIKIISILFIVLFAVSVLLGIIFMFNLDENMLLVWSYILAIGAIGAVVVFGLMNMFSSKKSIITSLSVIAGFAVLLGISFAFASDIIPLDAAGVPFEITSVVSQWSGATLYLLYVLLGLSFASLIYTEIKGAFK